MSLKDEVKNGKSMGTTLPPILKMTEKKGSEFLGKFLEYRHIAKEIKTGKKTEERTFDVFSFEAVKATGVEVTPGNNYSIFATGHLRHLLAEVIGNVEAFKGKTFCIGYLGTEKMSAGTYRGKEAHKWEVTIGS